MTGIWIAIAAIIGLLFILALFAVVISIGLRNLYDLISVQNSRNLELLEHLDAVTVDTYKLLTSDQGVTRNERVEVLNRHQELMEALGRMQSDLVGLLAEANALAEKRTPQPEPIAYQDQPQPETPSAGEGQYVTWADVRRLNEQRRQREAAREAEMNTGSPDWGSQVSTGVDWEGQMPAGTPKPTEAVERAWSQVPEPETLKGPEVPSRHIEEGDRRMYTNFDEVLRRAHHKEEEGE